MATVLTEHIMVDEKGVARIVGSRSKVTQIVMDKQAYGWGPEEIQTQHPHLTLAQIHAAFVYYYDHQAELDAQIQNSLELAKRMRAAAGESPFTTRLRAEGKLP